MLYRHSELRANSTVEDSRALRASTMFDCVDGWTPARGARNTHSRRWLGCLLGSLLLHVPLTPLAGLLGLIAVLFGAPRVGDVPPAPPISEIPVELSTDDPSPLAPAANANGEASEAAAVAPQVPAAPELPRPPKLAPREVPDAGAPLDAGENDAGTDASAGDAGASDAGLADAGRGDAGPELAGADAGSGGISDPIGVSGAARRVADTNANIKIYIDTEKLRTQRIGRRIGALLAGVYQWRDFFGPTGIDPVQDVDRIFIAGPQLRNSAEVVAVIQHHLGEARMRAALDSLVKRDTKSGAWLDGGVPVATARADRAERYFVMPSSRIVVVTPASALAAARKLGPRASIPPLPDTQIATAHVATPWRAFMGLPVRIPKSIRWARIKVAPGEQGGAVIQIEAEDESEEAARENADELTRVVTAATQLDLGLLGAFLGQKRQRFVQSVSFEATDARIFGRLVLTESQLLSLLDIGALLLTPAAPAPRSDAGAPRP